MQAILSLHSFKEFVLSEYKNKGHNHSLTNGDQSNIFYSNYQKLYILHVFLEENWTVLELGLENEDKAVNTYINLTFQFTYILLQQ